MSHSTDRRQRRAASPGGTLLSVVLPVYNEAKVLPALAEQLVAALGGVPRTTIYDALAGLQRAGQVRRRPLRDHAPRRGRPRVMFEEVAP